MPFRLVLAWYVAKSRDVTQGRLCHVQSHCLVVIGRASLPIKLNTNILQIARKCKPKTDEDGKSRPGKRSLSRSLFTRLIDPTGTYTFLTTGGQGIAIVTD